MDANFLRYQVIPAKRGIDALTDALEKELMEDATRKAADLMGMQTTREWGHLLIWDQANRHLYRFSYDAAPTLHWVRSNGKGTHGTVWDSGDWDTNFEVPQSVLDLFKSMDIPSRVKTYKQDLVANNLVLQKAAKADLALTKKVEAIFARASRLEDRHGYNSFSTCFDNWEGSDEEAELQELVHHAGFYCKEWVDFVTVVFEMWADYEADMA